MVSKKELLMVSHLRNNSRESLTRLSKKTKVPISTLHDKLKTRCGEVIKKNIALIDFSKVGFHTRAYITMRVNKKQRNEIREYLRKQQELNTLLRINNGYDFLIEGVFRNLHAMEMFIERLEEKFDIREKRVYHVINNIKQEAFMASPESMEVLGMT